MSSRSPVFPRHHSTPKSPRNLKHDRDSPASSCSWSLPDPKRSAPCTAVIAGERIVESRQDLRVAHPKGACVDEIRNRSMSFARQG